MLNFEAFVPEIATGPSKALVDNVSLMLENNLSIQKVVNLSNKELFIYPIPNSGEFTINNKKGEVIDSVEIFDVSGRLIQRVKQNSPSKKINITVNKEVNSGVYFVKTHTRNKEIITRRIIIE